MTGQENNVMEVHVLKSSELPAFLEKLTKGEFPFGAQPIQEYQEGDAVSNKETDASIVFDTIAGAVERKEKVARVELEKGYLKMVDADNILMPPLQGNGLTLVTGSLRTATFTSPEDGSQLAVTTLGGRLISLSDGERELDIQAAAQAVVNNAAEQTVTGVIDTAEVQGGELAQPVKRVFTLHGRPIEIGQIVYIVTDPVEIVAIYEAAPGGEVKTAIVREVDAEDGDAEQYEVPAHAILYRPIPQATLEKCRNAAPQKRKAQYRVNIQGFSFITEEKFSNENHLIKVLKNHGITSYFEFTAERLTATESW